MGLSGREGVLSGADGGGGRPGEPANLGARIVAEVTSHTQPPPQPDRRRGLYSYGLHPSEIEKLAEGDAAGELCGADAESRL